MERNSIIRNRDLRYIYGRVVDVRPDGWCKVIFNFRSSYPEVFNYRIEHLEENFEPVQQ